jgi:voltage-gated potassium channel
VKAAIVSQHIPHPAHLERLQQPPLVRRLRRLAGTLRHNGKVQFAGIFLGFVLAGTLIEFLLEGNRQGSPFADLFNSLWFTVVTITTVGYGDISPILPEGRLWAMVEMLVGIALVGIITGSVASALVEGNRRRALGLVPLKNIEDHIVVCGWKRDVRNILLGILAANRWLTAYDLVLVTTHPPNQVGELKRERRLKGLHYVYGSHTDRNVLEMARVAQAQRVIILADEMGREGGGDPDSRTVLSATAVEALSQEVYTCAEIIHPNLVPYLRPAGVEEVVLEARNATDLITAAALGDGITKVMDQFLPGVGHLLRILPIPPGRIGGTYGELAEEAASLGYQPLGLLENVGRLHNRKRERIQEALRQPTYRQAVETLNSATNMESNVPLLAPPPEREIKDHSRLVVLRPTGHRQPLEQVQRRRGEQTVPRQRNLERLVVCGWRKGMAELLAGIKASHRELGRRLAPITVLGSLPQEEARAIASHPALKKVRVVHGDPTDSKMLVSAGIRQASRVLVLTDPARESSPQEADARNVMISVAINEINPAVYKCVEVINPRFAEHLRIASVEEAIFPRLYQRMMLVQASLGTGLASAVGILLNPIDHRLRVVDFPPAPAGTPFALHAEALAAQGMLLIGAMEHTGNTYFRKEGYIREAQIQPRVKGAVAHLLRLKRVNTNEPLLNPGADFIPGMYSRAIVIVSEPEA